MFICRAVSIYNDRKTVARGYRFQGFASGALERNAQAIRLFAKLAWGCSLHWSDVFWLHKCQCHWEYCSTRCKIAAVLPAKAL